jgi:hypothetical protein
VGHSRVWISSTDAVSVVQKGFRIVHAPSDYFYLVRETRPSICLQRLTATLGLRGWRVDWQLHDWKILVRSVQDLAKGIDHSIIAP